MCILIGIWTLTYKRQAQFDFSTPFSVPGQTKVFYLHNNIFIYQKDDYDSETCYIVHMFWTFCCDICMCKKVPKAANPPVWENTYQYELFEKLYTQLQYLNGAMRDISCQPSQTKCQKHWATGNDTCYHLLLHRKRN